MKYKGEIIMKKKLFCLLMAAVMSVQGGAMVFAASPKHVDSVDTKAVMQIAESKKAGLVEVTAASGSSVTVTKRPTEPFPKFDYLCTLDMENVREKFNFYYESWDSLADYADMDDERKAGIVARIEDLKVTGEFTIEITYPKSLEIPEKFLESGKMAGFDDNAKLIFGDDERSVIKGDNNNTIQIVVKVVGEEENGRPGYVLGKDLKDNVDSYLSDLTLSFENVKTTKYGTFNVTGKMTGFTLAEEDESDNVFLKVDYKTNPEKATARCTVKEVVSGDSHIGGSDNHRVSFEADGIEDIVLPVRVEKNTELNLELIQLPYRDGYIFDGWYTDKELTNKVVEGMFIDGDVKLYGQWVKAPNTKNLNDSEHFAYVIGYPEGDVRPENFISREEITTIFFRLMKDEERNAIMLKTNEFSDITADRWSNTAISTMENGGYVSGYPDGDFRPEDFITRAEFATIAARLEGKSDAVLYGFADVKNHWAKDYIASAAASGWITGYEDGTFRPENYITRAEAMAIINRMLNRFVKADGLHSDAVLWPDNDEAKWYYYAVEEATNTHEYERAENAVYETWTSVLPNRDWTEFEK